MNIYSLLKINRFINNPMIKNLGIWLLHVLNKPYLVVFFDPVLGCNLRCRMCYFSDDEKRKTKKGVFAQDDLSRIAEVIFPQALKLQIGCGAEPLLFKHNTGIIRLGKQYGIPYISLTTNANGLSSEEIEKFLDAGLDEFTISLHGVKKDSYEFLMQGASYDKFISALQAISSAKGNYPNFKLRINYTVCEQNIDELIHFFDVFGEMNVDILQVRPLQDIGGKIKSIKEQKAFNARFNTITTFLKTECLKRKITYIAPLHLDEKPKKNKSNSILDSVYCYISPNYFWRDIDWRNETFKQYAQRTHYASFLFKNIFSQNKSTENKLDYDIV